MKLNRSKDKWDRYGQTRLLSRNRLLFERHRLLIRYFLDFFKNVDTAAEVLDVGCGEGLFLELLRNLGFQKLSGIDLSGSMIKRAQQKGLKVSKKKHLRVGWQKV